MGGDSSSSGNLLVWALVIGGLAYYLDLKGILKLGIVNALGRPRGSSTVVPSSLDDETPGAATGENISKGPSTPAVPIGAIDPNGIKLLYKTTGNKVAMKKGAAHRNGQRYSVNHKFQNYMMIGYFKTTSNQKQIEMKTDGPCFPAGYDVLTSKGMLPIEQVSVGDYVYTHQGRFRKVLQTMKRHYEGPVYSVKSFGSNFETTATEEHPFYVNEGEWKDVKNLKVTDKLILSVPSVTRDITEINIPYVKRSIFAPKTGKHYCYFSEENCVLPLQLNHDLLTLIGYYLAEGWLTKSEAVPTEFRRVKFSFGKSDVEYQHGLEVLQAATRLGFKPGIKLTKCGWHVQIGSIPLASWLHKEFGTYAKSKRIPQWIIELPREKLAILLDKYLVGDGYKVKVRKEMYRANSTSKNLLIGIMLISLKLGFKTSLSHVKRKATHVIEGRTVKQNQLYEIIINKNAERTRYIQNDSRHYRQAVRSIEKKFFSGMVYNIEVEEDNSYCVNNHIVHNCHGCHGSPCTKLPECMWYEPDLYMNGTVRMGMEYPHPVNHAAPSSVLEVNKPLGVSLSNKWIGYAVVAYWNASKQRVIEQWADPDPFDAAGKPKNGWVLTLRGVEKGQIFPKQHANRALPVNFHEGLEAEIRMHAGAQTPGADMKSCFVYEIVPPN